jgi:2'-5' RNA ligase
MSTVAQQLAFDFGERRRYARRRTDNLFFAALPDPVAARQIAAVTADLRSAHGLAGRPRPMSSLHVSLVGVGEFVGLPDAVVKAAIRAGSTIRFASFEARFTRVMSFDGKLSRGQPRAVVLRCDRGEREFIGLRRAIGTAMRPVCLSRGLPEGFAPHLTVLYDEGSLPENALAESIAWTVSEVVLVHSLVGRGRHVHLARWPLRG